jgi:hypothetical protein
MKPEIDPFPDNTPSSLRALEKEPRFKKEPVLEVLPRDHPNFAQDGRVHHAALGYPPVEADPRIERAPNRERAKAYSSYQKYRVLEGMGLYVADFDTTRKAGDPHLSKGFFGYPHSSKLLTGQENLLPHLRDVLTMAATRNYSFAVTAQALATGELMDTKTKSTWLLSQAPYHNNPGDPLAPLMGAQAATLRTEHGRCFVLLELVLLRLLETFLSVGSVKDIEKYASTLRLQPATVKGMRTTYYLLIPKIRLVTHTLDTPSDQLTLWERIPQYLTDIATATSKGLGTKIRDLWRNLVGNFHFGAPPKPERPRGAAADLLGYTEELLEWYNSVFTFLDELEDDEGDTEDLRPARRPGVRINSTPLAMHSSTLETSHTDDAQEPTEQNAYFDSLLHQNSVIRENQSTDERITFSDQPSERKVYPPRDDNLRCLVCGYTGHDQVSCSVSVCIRQGENVSYVLSLAALARVEPKMLAFRLAALRRGVHPV